METEGAKETLLAKLEARGGKEQQSRRAGVATLRAYPRDGGAGGATWGHLRLL
jgi:hypothetical protein